MDRTKENELYTERLILRPWRESDAESLYRYAKDPLVGPIAGWPVHTSVDNSLDIIRGVLSAPDTYAVCLKEDNIAIGSIGLIPPMQSHTKAQDDEIEVGYWLGVPFWGHGYMPEALKRMEQHAFEDLGCSAMWCGYYDGNTKSKRCQEKGGFVYHHTEPDKPCELMGDVRTEHFTRLTKEMWKKKDSVVFFVHGKGGNAGEADHYKSLFARSDIYGMDYKSTLPWETSLQISEVVGELATKYNEIILVANSIGAYMSMNSHIEKYIKRAYFISPIVNMVKLIEDMMMWAHVTENELEEKKIIDTDFGEQLSYEYLCYARENRKPWVVPTKILYGSTDNLTSYETIREFSDANGCELTVMNGGEHWFHTDEQMELLDRWVRKSEGKDMGELPSAIRNAIGTNEGTDSYCIDNMGKSNANVFMYSDKVLKIADICEESANERVMLEWLNGKLPVPKLIEHVEENGKSYILMSRCLGEMLCSKNCMENLDRQAELLATALKELWSVSISDCPMDNSLKKKLETARYNVENGLVDISDCEPDTFGEGGFKDPEELLQWLYDNQPVEELVLSHGDLSLPNIYVDGDRVTGFIDLGKTGIADKWCDIAISYRSLSHNQLGVYGGPVHKDYDKMILFDKLGIQPDWQKIRYYMLLDEVF